MFNLKECIWTGAKDQAKELENVLQRQKNVEKLDDICGILDMQMVMMTGFV